MNTKEILKKIKITRLVNEISQEQMAKKLQISVPTYCRFEKGITKTNVELLQNVSQILKLDFFYPKENDILDIVNEDFSVYVTKSADIQKQLHLLVKLIEKQQEINTITLEKLKILQSKYL
ncbi:MAG: hypothetical protein A3K10_11445 [Bacteroidetes bacterium RIFCSPLOWO2_12_FULL_31_6]|nr:MAG: hypothetical protein A3K10_11445 [Bacteroidetes bacterium RIFCSPLOWO2_12_FULL_31_6]